MLINVAALQSMLSKNLSVQKSLVIDSKYVFVFCLNQRTDIWEVAQQTKEGMIGLKETF